ncbi:MAG TPA: hypothetical protein VK616_06830, partial [Flavitalea sp.]|nr:hypothetical protein [Flavitalea sp.]
MHSKVHSQNEGKQDSKLILRSTNLQLLVVLCLLSSCASYKKIPYFQDLNKYSYSKTVIENYTPLTIQPQDILGIYVTSLNPEASSIFNYNLNRVKGNNDYSADNPVAGYLVDE